MGTAFHYLAEYPEITKALIEEVKTFQEPLDFDELKSAPVLNAFVAECWRMDPPVSLTFRKITETQQYKGYQLTNAPKYFWGHVTTPFTNSRTIFALIVICLVITQWSKTAHGLQKEWTTTI